MARLESLFGQDTAVRALRRALESDCMPGAYLIVGQEGTGKSAVAAAFAQAAACLSPALSPFDSCGRCESCRRAEAASNPDILTIKPAGEQLQIWQLWDRQGRAAPGVLSRTLAYAPVVGKRRVYIIERADRLTESAANSLLKVLEEPPPYALFLLLAPHPARVLPTILSRSQVVRLRAVPVADLAQYLQETFGLEAESAAAAAAYAEGRVGQAITMAGTPAVGEEIARVLDFAESLPQAPAYRALRAAEQMRKLAAQTKALLGEEPAGAADAADADAEPTAAKEKTGRRQFAAVIDLLVTFYRDLLALRVGGTAEALVHRNRAAALERLADLGRPERWTGCLDALLLARRRLDANANTSLVTEILLMKLLAR
jgi:DNA polymerase III subunit delta'